MVLSAGDRLGSYEIRAPLGVGGMGEVYRATDTSLGRDVAIKVLPAEVSGDAERLARFQREARLLASLNHPNIAAIHGLEEADGQPFLVLELVEGEDLAERLGRGKVPVDEALEIAKQIAEALEEAHSKGIVHRDLKPANVKLTPDGQVKVLDFGLAKAYRGDPTSGVSAEELSQSPTLARSGTHAGVILGTAAYMSPEQAAGKAVDKRTDIWAFGVVLFEMLTGQPLFRGGSVPEVLAAVLKEEPEWERLPPDCPPVVARLLRHCLRKRPRERLQDVGDARLELSDVLAGDAEKPGAAAPRDTERRTRLSVRAAWVAGAVIVGLAGVFAWLHFTRAPEPSPAVRFSVDMPDDVSVHHIDLPVVSPDGRHLAFPAQIEDPGEHTVWLRTLGERTTHPLPGTEGAWFVTWSPDSRSVAFMAGWGTDEPTLKTVAVEGGPPRTVCTVPHPRFAGLTWGEDGTIVFSSGSSTVNELGVEQQNAIPFRLFSVAVEEGDARPLTVLDTSRGETGHFFPQLLSGGRLLYGVASDRPENDGVHVASLDAPDDKQRLDVPLSGRANFSWAPPGHLVFAREGSVLAQPVDLRGLRTTEQAVELADDISVASTYSQLGNAVSNLSAAGERALAYVEQSAPDYELAWFDRRGARLGTVGKPGTYRQLALSPDDRRVATALEGDIWVIEVERGVATRVTSDPASDGDPVWSADGQELFYVSPRDGWEVRRQRPGANESESLVVHSLANVCWPESVSADGEALVCIETRGASTDVIGLGMLALSGEGEGRSEPLLRTGFPIEQPETSPDDRWLTYNSNETGDWEVYVAPFRRAGETVRVSPEGGRQPKWRGDGRELFYVTPDGQLVAVEVREQGGRLEVGRPRGLFAAGVTSARLKQYDVTVDGQRFLVRTPVGQRTRSVDVILNWTALLE